jgi:hypothetical protein
LKRLFNNDTAIVHKGAPERHRLEYCFRHIALHCSIHRIQSAHAPSTLKRPQSSSTSILQKAQQLSANLQVGKWPQVRKKHFLKLPKI